MPFSTDALFESLKRSLDNEKVKECIRLATRSTSSNMQLWEFYQITTLEVLEKLTRASFNQNAAKTAKQMIVVVARKDLEKRVRSNVAFKITIWRKLPADYSKREKFALNYQKIVPTLYFDFLGILGTLKFLVFKLSDYLSLFIDKQEVICDRSPKKCCISCTKLYD
jgi:hypothetical protein